MVALGFIVGTHLAARRAAKAGLSVKTVYDAALLCLVFGILGAHVVSFLGDRPANFWTEPWRLLEFWSGLSSYGGFLGAGIALVIYFRRKHLPFFPYADTLMFGLFPGWTLGRLGCFSAHDHPGRLSDFIFAVGYPGGARHDLGFYEAVLSLVLSVTVYVLGRRERSRGLIFAVAALLYALPRFFLDFLRATDLPGSNPRYGGLTPAQFGSIALGIWGVYLLFKLRRAKVCRTDSSG